MTLGFSTEIHGKPTYFVEKIWKSIQEHEITKELCEATFLHGFHWEKFGSVAAKKHTIRQDNHNRWKPGNLIHFVINNRTPNRFQFAPVIDCKNTQSIEIVWHDKYDNNLAIPVIYIDGNWITGDAVDQLAVNEGFDSTEDFYRYFNEWYFGIIIHWTDLKY